MDSLSVFFFFFFNDTATTEIYTLSLHDALPISPCWRWSLPGKRRPKPLASRSRSEEHTSELQSHSDLVCRLLLEKKKKTRTPPTTEANPRYRSHVHLRHPRRDLPR